MNLAEAQIVVRPRGQLESLDLAFRYVLGDARRLFFRVGLLTLVPAFGLTVAARLLFAWSWFAVWPVALVLGVVARGAFTVASGRHLFESAVDARTVLRAYAARLPPFVGAVLGARALTILGWLLVAPGLLAWLRYAFVAEAVLLEQVPVRRALSRSAWLSRAGTDGMLGSLTTELGLSLAMIVALETIATTVVEDVLSLPFHSSRLLVDGGSYFALAAYFAILPWSAASRFLAYIDGRTRHDGWDVQVKFMALPSKEAS